MKTTIDISDELFRELEAEAVRQGKSLSEFVEGVIRLFLPPREEKTAKAPPPLPVYHLGQPRIEISDRVALYDFMDEI